MRIDALDSYGYRQLSELRKVVRDGARIAIARFERSTVRRPTS